MKRQLFRKIFYIWFLCCGFIQCSNGGGAAQTQVDEFTKQDPDPIESIDCRDVINQDIAQSRHNAITHAVSKVSPAVVGINVVQIKRYRQRSVFDDDPFWGRFYQPREYQQKVQGLGSGFLISPDGLILTNEHVIHEAVEIVVTTTGGKQYQAKLIGQSREYDVALLKIDGKDFPYIPLGDSDDTVIGEWVIAFGNPFGLFNVNSQPTVTVGVLSAVHMDFQKVEGRTYNGMLQTDAAINGGNSGGPLINCMGKCIGINTFIISGSGNEGTNIGISFAIPVNFVKSILPDLKSIGNIDRPSDVGLKVQDVNWLVARMLGINPGDGVLVGGFENGSAGQKAGIEVGDVIIAINSQRIRTVAEYQAAFEKTEVRKFRVVIYRDRKLYELDIDLDS